jgi:DNA-binding transcriptional LysR family regulator
LDIRVELRQLRYFAVLAEELNFTRAADRLHISQPPLSAQIAQLEQELGAQLLHRNSRRVVLTDAGAAFLQETRLLLQRLDEAQRHVRQVHEGLAGRVEIGVSGSHFLGPLPRRLGLLAQVHPGIVVAIRELSPSRQLEALRESRIDLSISRQQADDEMLRSRLLWPDPVVVALPAAHPLALDREHTLPLASLAAEPFIMLERDSSSFAARVYQACAAQGFTPRVTHTVVEVPTQLSLVQAGLGIALVPASTSSYRQDGLAFRNLEATGLQADVYAVTRIDSRNAALETIQEFLTP